MGDVFIGIMFPIERRLGSDITTSKEMFIHRLNICNKQDQVKEKTNYKHLSHM